MELLTRNDLAKRWKISLDSVDDMRNKKIIKQVPRLTCIRFNLQHIEAIEGTTAITGKSTIIEKQHLEKELEILKLKVQSYDLMVTQIMNAAANIINS